MAASGQTPNYQLPYPLSTDVVDVAGDIELLATEIDTELAEITQDIFGGMVTSNTETGITVTYNDTTGKINFALVDDYLKTAVAPLLDHEDHIGIIAVYNSEDQKIVLENTGGGGGGGGSASSTSLSVIWWLGV